ncbi:MAG: hypothetical protein HZA89_12650 [Verrucomicrobia bacterium]|nr:hypothetical protein [Verrucomicrobiota bacterium]
MPEKETTYETYETTDVPPARLSAVVAGYMADDPIRVEKIKQDDGNWTVRATYQKG